LTEDQFQKEVSPGRNRVYYIVGHLAAYHDRLLPMLGFGDKLHPELDELFIVNPDRSFADEVTGLELRAALKEVNEALTKGAEAMTASDWLKKHSAVTDEDFAKEPHRNRIAVFESRTVHAMFHVGQVRLVTAP
jgi:hypothetical protein